MKFKFILAILMGLILSGCVGVSSKGVFGTGVSIAFDPRTVGTQMDDSIMQKNLAARILIKDKKYLLSVKSKVLDGRIFLTGKVDSPEEKLLLTKLAWETKGARSVRNDIKIKDLRNYIDWSIFFRSWDLAGSYPKILKDEVVGEAALHTEIAVVDTYFVIETDRLNLIVLNTQGNGTTITAVTADRINFLELPGTGLELEGPWQESTNRAHGETLTAEFTVQASIIRCGNFGLKASINK